MIQTNLSFSCDPDSLHTLVSRLLATSRGHFLVRFKKIIPEKITPERKGGPLLINKLTFKFKSATYAELFKKVFAPHYFPEGLFSITDETRRSYTIVVAPKADYCREALLFQFKQMRHQLGKDCVDKALPKHWKLKKTLPKDLRYASLSRSHSDETTFTMNRSFTFTEDRISEKTRSFTTKRCLSTAASPEKIQQWITDGSPLSIKEGLQNLSQKVLEKANQLLSDDPLKSMRFISKAIKKFPEIDAYLEEGFENLSEKVVEVANQLLSDNSLKGMKFITEAIETLPRIKPYLKGKFTLSLTS